MDWSCQRSPFHRSASVRSGLDRLWEAPPTAVQARGEEHATDDRKLIPALTGLGVDSIFHLPAGAAPALPACAAPAMTTTVMPASTVNASRPPNTLQVKTVSLRRCITISTVVSAP